MKRTLLISLGLLVATFCFVGNTNANDTPKDLYDLIFGIDEATQVEINAVSVYVFEVTVEKSVQAYLFVVVRNHEIELIILATGLSPPSVDETSLNSKQISKTESDKNPLMAFSKRHYWQIC